MALLEFEIELSLLSRGRLQGWARACPSEEELEQVENSGGSEIEIPLFSYS